MSTTAAVSTPRASRARSTRQHWLDGQTAAIMSGTHVAPRDAALTVAEWCELWLDGYQVHRASTVAQAAGACPPDRRRVRRHAAVGAAAVAGEGVAGRRWQREHEASYVHALHCAAVADLLRRRARRGARAAIRARGAPRRRWVSPKLYLATTEQVWAIHDAMPEHLRVAVLLGAFAGLRIAEVSGLRVADVDFTRGVVHPEAAVAGQPAEDTGQRCSRSRFRATWRCCWPRRCRSTRAT